MARYGRTQPHKPLYGRPPAFALPVSVTQSETISFSENGSFAARSLHNEAVAFTEGRAFTARTVTQNEGVAFAENGSFAGRPPTQNETVAFAENGVFSGRATTQNEAVVISDTGGFAARSLQSDTLAFGEDRSARAIFDFNDAIVFAENGAYRVSVAAGDILSIADLASTDQVGGGGPGLGYILRDYWEN